MTSFEKRKTRFEECQLAFLVDDESDRHHGVLVAPAASMTAERVNRILHLAKGNLQVALSPERAHGFSLESMNHSSPFQNDADLRQPRECVSVEAREGISTGISAADRAATIRILGEKDPNPRKLVKPGHIFPVRTRQGGVLVRSSLPEGALDLVRMSGFSEAAAFADVLHAKGSLASLSDLQQLSQQEEIPLFRIAEIVGERLRHEKLVYRVAEAKLPTQVAGEMISIAYRSDVYKGEHIALTLGDLASDEPVLVRVQPESTYTDLFGSLQSTTAGVLSGALQEIGKARRGVLIYLRSVDSGLLSKQLTGGNRQRSAVMKEYGVGAQILRDLGVSRITLLSNTKKPIAGLESFGLEIVGYHPLPSVEVSTQGAAR